MAIVIGLGSNLQQPLLQLRKAYQLLSQHPAITLKASSAIYQSKPLLPEQAPESWQDKCYLNAAVRIETQLHPRALLACLKKIESEMGRPPAERWSPRVIDLDILIFDEITLAEQDFHLPHAEL